MTVRRCVDAEDLQPEPSVGWLTSIDPLPARREPRLPHGRYNYSDNNYCHRPLARAR